LVAVAGVTECIKSFTCQWNGRDVFCKGVEDGRQGWLLPSDHPFVAEHSEMFAPFRLTLVTELDQ
jgi:hypothetical protein